jgi:hypothetical protein
MSDNILMHQEIKEHSNKVSKVVDERLVYPKYSECKILDDLEEYLMSTYGQHYAADNNVSCFDCWEALGNATTTSRDIAMKYLWRYGKKNSVDASKKDLFKAMHYIMFMLYNDHYKNRSE